MSKRLIIQGGMVVSAGTVLHADIIIAGEHIAAVSTNAQPEAGDQVLDAQGCYVLPGIIDAHTHIKLDTGIYQTDDDWFTGTRAAAFGGVTTVIDFATQFPGQSFREAMSNRRAEAAGAVIDYGLHCMVTDLPPGQEDKLGELTELGVAGTKLYTTYRPNYYADDAAILRILSASGETGGLVIVHCENDDLVTAATQKLVAEDRAGWANHGRSRPALAEQEAIARVLLLAEAAGAPVYIVHCSTARSIELVRQAREAGQVAYCETCPQYLLLDNRAYDGPHPEHYILQPPLRRPGEGSTMWQQVAAGMVDAIVTDHCDYALAQKQAKDDLTTTPGGLPGVETLLPLCYTYGVDAGWINISQLVYLLSSSPAQVYGMYPQKGALLPGTDADVVIYDPSGDYTIDPAALHYVADYNPYAGMAVRGRVRATISRGEVVIQEGQFHGTAGHGRFVPCHRGD